MRFTLSMLCLFMLGLGILTACRNAAAPPTRIEEEAPRISLADAKANFDSGNTIFVDTRSDTSYKMEHIKGAVNLPLADFDARYKEFSSGKKIIAYCS